MREITIACLFLIFTISVHAQPKHDYNWLLGYPPNIPDEHLGGARLNFHKNPVEVSFFETPIGFEAISMMSDSSGQLMFYTNGCEVINAEHELMVNGDSINAGVISDIYCKDGYPTHQGVMSLLLPNSKNIYYLFHTWVNEDYLTAEIRYSIIDMDKQNGMGEVIEKNTLLLPELNTGQISAVRHGNGRDWWIIVPKDESNEYFRFLFDPSGVTELPPQAIGAEWTFRDWSGQAVFSPDGSKYIRMNPFNGLHIFDFDRCSGELFNSIQIDFPQDTFFSGGVSVSPNNRYLYVSATLKIYQFDLWSQDIADSRVTVAEYDGFLSPFYTVFYQHMLAPNGKIYITAPNSVNILHVINQPNKAGVKCDLEQHGMILPTLHAFQVPNFPYFALSAEDGSPCDTLGIDMPVAIREHKEGLYFNIHPNPAQDRLYIGLPENFPGGSLQWQLFDAQGRRVMQQALSFASERVELALEGLPDGFYFYRILNGQELLQSGKVVLQR